MKQKLRAIGVLILALLTGSLSGRAALPLPAPEVAVSVNDAREIEVFRGMPLLVCAGLVHPLPFDTNAAPILVAGLLGPWTTAVQLEVTDEQGDAVTWPFHASAATSNTVVLHGAQFAELYRWLTPQETSLVSTGKYLVAATLNTTNVILPGAWKGLAESVPAEVTMVNEPATLSEEQAANKYSQLAMYELFLNNGTGALNQVDQWLALYPTNISAMRVKALVLDRLGRTAEAFSVSEQALAQVRSQNPNLPEPPNNLLELQRQLEAKLTPAVLAFLATNQQLSVSWVGHPDLSYRLESSADLVTWSLVATNFTIVGDTLSLDIPLSANRRFFRVMR